MTDVSERSRQNRACETYRYSARDDGCHRGGVGGAHGDEDEHEAHEQRPQREPVGARPHALDDAARRAPAIEVERPWKGGCRNRATADLDGAAAGKRDNLAVVAAVGRPSDVDTILATAVGRPSDVNTIAPAAVGRPTNINTILAAAVRRPNDINTILAAAIRRPNDINAIAAAGRRRVGLESAARRRRYLGVDATALTDGATRGQVGPATCLVGALGGIAEVLDICPPGAGPRM